MCVCEYIIQPYSLAAHNVLHIRKTFYSRQSGFQIPGGIQLQGFFAAMK